MSPLELSAYYLVLALMFVMGVVVCANTPWLIQRVRLTAKVADDGMVSVTGLITVRLPNNEGAVMELVHQLGMFGIGVLEAKLAADTEDIAIINMRLQARDDAQLSNAIAYVRSHEVKTHA